ncbi:hypothetical protein M089_1316 [Bacteroides ovatus str. 3725 D9 iii]|nr:hypothetical protein M089_1316 [Bacteroides ovatus str. 3725 D9 iii]KXT44209.1 hypothetical protein HMPREF2532_03454 [Bacteroides ovatus]
MRPDKLLYNRVFPVGTTKIEYNHEEWIRKNEDFTNFAPELHSTHD